MTNINTSHLKIVCKCPECGADFFYWLKDGHDMDLETVKMEMATTYCARCTEEWNAKNDYGESITDDGIIIHSSEIPFKTRHWVEDMIDDRLKELEREE